MGRLHQLALRRGVIATLLVATIVPATPSAQPAPPAGKPATPPAARPAAKPTMKLPTIERFALGNGLQVAVVRTDVAPVVAVQLWYRAGSKDERRDRRGSAHMFEHIMFKGTKHVRAEAHAQFINGVGGYVNAQTDEDATHYVNTVPADYLDFALRLEAERMRGLLFRPEVIATEREVVKEEIRQRENAPLLKGYLRFLEIAFSKHPYAWTASGDIKGLDATTPDDLKKFYDDYYQPNNALLVVVGKTTVEDVKASAEKHFGPIPKGAEPPRPSRAAAEPPQTSKRREVVEAGQVGLTLVGYHIPAAKEKDIYALQLAAIILGAGDSSRLLVRLKSTNDPKLKKPLAVRAGMEALVREEPGMAIAFGAYLDPQHADAVEAALLEEIGKLGTAGPKPDELRKAKNQIQSAFLFSLENAQGLAQAIGRSWILTGDATMFMRDVDAIERLTTQDITAAVKKYMRPELATIVVIPPRTK